MTSPTLLSVAPFGSIPDSGEVHAITMRSKSGVEVELLSYGGAIRRLLVPGNDGETADVALGFETLDGYLGKENKNPYFGCLVGRVANRIAGGKFSVGSEEFTLAKNNGENALHGGLKALDKEIWSFTTTVGSGGAPSVTFTHSSPDGSNGYPGNVDFKVVYSLSATGVLSLDYSATTDQTTPINLTNHCYFNLAGHSTGPNSMLSQLVQIPNGPKLTAVDASTLIPTGELSPVEGTRFDLTGEKTLKDVMGEEGFDHNFCLFATESSERSPSGLLLAAKVTDPGSGRVMSVYTDQPGVQFYTGNFLPASLPGGKDGAVYTTRGGFCLETQDYPDAVNQPTFPSVLLKPGQRYRRRTEFAFGKK